MGAACLVLNSGICYGICGTDLGYGRSVRWNVYGTDLVYGSSVYGTDTGTGGNVWYLLCAHGTDLG
eukprot:86610-Rhodomonas_salina.7